MLWIYPNTLDYLTFCTLKPSLIDDKHQSKLGHASSTIQKRLTVKILKDLALRRQFYHYFSLESNKVA